MSVPLESLRDEELARQTQAGYLAAFEQLVYRYEGRIYGFILNSGHRDADAREITQDAFVRAFQAIGQYDPGRAFSPWLFTIARRKCVDHHRSASPPAEAHLAEEPDLNDPAELLAREEDRRDLWRLARRRLAKPQFQALWLRYVEDLSVAEIARVLRKTQTHVKVLLFRARHTLGRELEKSAPPARSDIRPVAPLSPIPHSLRKERHANLAP